jgi:hypothetical protein
LEVKRELVVDLALQHPFGAKWKAQQTAPTWSRTHAVTGAPLRSATAIASA